MIDKNYCMSSYLAFRYIEKEDANFEEGMHHEIIPKIAECEKVYVETATDINKHMEMVFQALDKEKLGILLSGGMDSANLASYMEGMDAYTFRFENGFQNEELKRAEYYAQRYYLRLHYVDITWEKIENCLPDIMKRKGAPVHSIEPQIYLGASQAKEDGITKMITGASADLIFGGMDQLLAHDWCLKDFQNRYIFTNPEDVLEEPEDITYAFERYRQGEKIDFLSFMNEISLEECSGSYWNAFACAGMPYIDPYARLRMKFPLDLYKVRHGESKYLIRDLFRMRYPEIPVPDKVPMPRPVDKFFADWKGPTRKEFKENLDMTKFTGNQKWQLYCLERFLELLEMQH